MKELPPSPDRKEQLREFMDSMAPGRSEYLRKNRYYHRQLSSLVRFLIPENNRVLEIGCGLGQLLKSLNPSRGVGIDISAVMAEQAAARYPDLHFRQMEAENLLLEEKFDYILVSDTLGFFWDIQKVFGEIKKVMEPGSRLVLTYHNFLWQPVFSLLERMKIKMPQVILNWINRKDIGNLLHLEGYEIIRSGTHMLLPLRIPVISDLVNRYFSKLPFLRQLCVTRYIVAGPGPSVSVGKELSVSVIIPARNERGNIESAVRRVPAMGTDTEIIFIEGGSEDGTLEKIEEVCRTYTGPLTLRHAVQSGTGKADAVHTGFQMARGDVLMILDADLTVLPEELPKFYDAIRTEKGDFINGTRLVYPLEKDSMRLLNMLGNHFFSQLFTWLLEQPVRDTLCGTKVLKKKNWEKIFSNREHFGDFDPFGDFELLFGAARFNLKMVEIPIRYHSRTYGSTNISRFRHGWLLLKMAFFAMKRIKFI